MAQERRQFQRLKYPSYLRPVLLAEGARLAVVDLSRNAVSFSFKRSLALRTGEAFIARLRLGRRYTPMFVGTVVRCNSDVVIARVEPDFDAQLLRREFARVSLLSQ